MTKLADMAEGPRPQMIDEHTPISLKIVTVAAAVLLTAGGALVRTEMLVAQIKEHKQRTEDAVMELKQGQKDHSTDDTDFRAYVQREQKDYWKNHGELKEHIAKIDGKLDLILQIARFERKK